MKREKQLSSSRNESSRDSRISLGIENLVPPAKKLTEEIPSERCCQSWCEANRRTRRSGNALREMHVVVERQSLFRHRRRRRLVPTSTCLIVVPTRNSNVKLSWLTVKFVKSSRNKVGAKFRVRCSWLRAVSPRIGCCFHTKKRD